MSFPIGSPLERSL